MIRVLIELLIASFVSYILCDIDPNKNYIWYHGVWHGFCFSFNFIMSLFTDQIYKAEYYSIGYNVWWWLLTPISILRFLAPYIWKKRDIY